MAKLYLLPVFCCFLILSSCKKTKVDNETVSSTDYALVSQEFMQLFIHANIATINQKGLFTGDTSLTFVFPGQSDSLSGDTTHDAQGVFTNTDSLPILWIKYNNCTGTDGKVRNGTIKISYTKQYNQIGCVATATLTNYTVNGITCQGTITLTRNTVTGLTYNITDGIFTNNTWNSKYNCNAVITLSDNGTTSVLNDDFVQFLGNANGINREGKKYNVTISESLKKSADCAWISQGIASLTPDGLHARTINFGNGNCDDVASFVIDSQTFTLHLSK